jgi:hypothetical protein
MTGIGKRHEVSPSSELLRFRSHLLRDQCEHELAYSSHLWGKASRGELDQGVLGRDMGREISGAG